MYSVNSLSAGKSSSYMAVKYPATYEVFSLVCIKDLESKPKDLTLINYVNEKLAKFIPEHGEFIATAEDDKSLVAMMDLEQYIGREIIWLRGKSFDEVIDEPSIFGGRKGRLPSWARRYCTLEMKLLPIFQWWFDNIGEKCNMRIGFRFDEYDRMERFFNNSDPTHFDIPVSCSRAGEKRQKYETFNWRYVHMPLVKAGITKQMVNDYWEQNGWIEGNIFQERKKIVFPAISNCVGCFHKNPETIAAESILNPSKIGWFMKQELKGMGTFSDDQLSYETIIAQNLHLGKLKIVEMNLTNSTCDSAGCTD